MASELRILDVGHGNSSLILSELACVVDCPNNTVLLDTLVELQITKLDVVLVSHPDADHLVGITNLLLATKIEIGTILANPNSEKRSRAFTAFLTAIEDAIQRGAVAKPVLTAEEPGEIVIGDVSIQILSPGGANAFVGAGGVGTGGKQITTNSASAVLKVLKDGQPKALLAGDMTLATLEDLVRRDVDLRAPILVFPHHGGRPETGDAIKFTNDLVELVDPELVIFSLGRGKYAMPRPDIVEALRRARPDSRLVCTQLSKHCAEKLEGLTFDHLDPSPALGKRQGASCTGSLTFVFDASLPDHKHLTAHSGFLAAQVPGALCRRALR